MKILVLGASSYVGARLYFDLRKNFEVDGTYSKHLLSDSFFQLDITDREAVSKAIEKVVPNVIVHAANNANARWCEANPQQATMLNETSTQYIVDAANAVGSRLIYISSFAVLNPDNVYGRTKLKSEEIVKQSVYGWLILRPSLILGYSPNTKNDRPFNRLLRNLDDGAKAEYDTSWKFQPTWIGHISEIIKICIDRDTYRETIPVAAADLKSRYDVALDILSPFGIKVFPIDKKDTLKVTQDNLEKLKQLNLPTHSYQDMINKIVAEIKQRKAFVI